MRKSHWLRLFAGAAAIACCHAMAAEYKCKDAHGKWTEQACPDFKQREDARRAEIAREAAKNREPTIGMTKDEVLALNWEFERPRHVMTTDEGGHAHEQWEAPCQFLYFDDNVLTATQWTCRK